MEEKSQKRINLVQKSYICPKLIIPSEVEQKIRFICQKIWDVEWSGTLFFTYKGSFENNDLEIICKDIYVMDIGTATYTEFDMSPEVISYMTGHEELLDCQIGLIHSHGRLNTFFSGTDTETLREEGTDRNNFVSLIVNNAGTYTAAITRKINSRHIKESVSYEFFGEGVKSNTAEYTNNEEEIEWFYMKIVKEEGGYSFSEIDSRLTEIKSKKNRAALANSTNSTSIITPPKIIPDLNKPVQGTLFDDTLPNNLPFNRNIVKSLVKQLVTCSIILPNESKIDVNKWASNGAALFEGRFGKGEAGLERFREWAECYLEFLTWTVDDPALKASGCDRSEIQAIYSEALIDALNELPKNKYINIYIEELEKYLIQ